MLARVFLRQPPTDIAPGKNSFGDSDCPYYNFLAIDWSDNTWSDLIADFDSENRYWTRLTRTALLFRNRNQSTTTTRLALMNCYLEPPLIKQVANANFLISQPLLAVLHLDLKNELNCYRWLRDVKKRSKKPPSFHSWFLLVRKAKHG